MTKGKIQLIGGDFYICVNTQGTLEKLPIQDWHNIFTYLCKRCPVYHKTGMPLCINADRKPCVPTKHLNEFLNYLESNQVRHNHESN